MDRFFALTKKTLKPTDLHLLGISSMFLAAKYEEIYPFKMRHVYEKIGHRKLSKSSIKEQEADICKTLAFNLSAVTSFDFTMNALPLIDVEDHLSRQEMKHFIKICIYLSKMNMMHYDIVRSTSKLTQGTATLYVAIKVME